MIVVPGQDLENYNTERNNKKDPSYKFFEDFRIMHLSMQAKDPATRRGSFLVSYTAPDHHSNPAALIQICHVRRALPVPVRYSFPDCDCPRSVPVFHQKESPHPSLPLADTEVPVTLPYTAHRFLPRMGSAHLELHTCHRM